VGPRDRLDARGPPPARLERGARGRRSGQVQNVDAPVLEGTRLVRLVERLVREVAHVNPPLSWTGAESTPSVCIGQWLLALLLGLGASGRLPLDAGDRGSPASEGGIPWRKPMFGWTNRRFASSRRRSGGRS